MSLSFYYIQLPSQVCMQPCDKVARCLLPCTFCVSFKMFNISVERQLAIGNISRLSLPKLKILSLGKHLKMGLPSRDWAAQT